MTFTVLGSTGFIGGALAARLRADGHTVHTPSRETASSPGYPLGHAIYAIGLTADFRTRPFDTARAHVAVLADLLESADFETFTYLSSTRVYRNSDTASVDQSLSVKPTDPSDLYNLTKLAGESLCLNCGRPGTKVVRLSNVIGISSNPSGNFVDDLLREAKSGQIALRSDPRSSKDYIRLDDVVEILPRIASEGRNKIYNLASGTNVTHADWLRAVRSLTGCEVTAPDGLAPVVFPTIDISLLVDEFGFLPRPVLDLLPQLIH